MLIAHESRFAGFQGGGETDERPEDLLAIQARSRSRREQFGGRGACDAEHRVRDKLQPGRAPETADVVDFAEPLQDGARLREILWGASDEHGKGPALDGGDAADHGRFEKTQPASTRLPA